MGCDEMGTMVDGSGEGKSWLCIVAFTVPITKLLVSEYQNFMKWTVYRNRTIAVCSEVVVE